MKIQTKTTILFTILTGTVFLVLILTVYYFSNKFVYNDFYKRLELRAKIAAKFAFEKDHTSTASFKAIQKQYLEKLPGEVSYTVALSADATPLPPLPAKVPLKYFKKIIAADGGTVYQQQGFVHYAGFLYKADSGQFLVIESALNTYGNDIVKKLGNILLITLVSSIVIIYTAGLYFSRNTFRPFSYITRQVQSISEGNLHLRLREHKGSDEIAVLVGTFNHMLDRLETAFETQNNFISNASHELRTPLTTIVAEADYALSQERTADAYRQSLATIVVQAEKLGQLTHGLLALAQTAFDGKKQAWQKIRLDELLFDVKQHAGTIFSNRIVLQLPAMPENADDICTTGNADLLTIAVGNIIINACKYSGNETVTVTLLVQDGQAQIVVADKGIGIPPAEVKHIYDPFFRASNTTGFEGYGIGMPLSGNIIRMHQGKITVMSVLEKGTSVTINLPLSGNNGF